MFDSFNDALAYLPVFQIYTWRALEELYNDNIMYAELRSTLRPVNLKIISIPFANNLYKLFSTSFMAKTEQIFQ